MRRVNVPLLLLFLGGASSAHANTYHSEVSEISTPILFPLMLLWIVAGVIGTIALRRRVRLDHVGFGALLCAGFGGLCLFFHEILDILVIPWMIYLTLSTVYYAFPRRMLPPAERRANLWYHGTFLTLAIAGGTIAKVIFYSKMGRFSSWLNEVKGLGDYLVWWGVLTLLLLGWFCLFTLWPVHRRAARRRAAEISALPSDDEPPKPLSP